MIKKTKLTILFLTAMLLLSACTNVIDNKTSALISEKSDVGEKRMSDIAVEVEEASADTDSNNTEISYTLITLDGTDYDLVYADLSEFVQALNESGIHAQNVKKQHKNQNNYMKWDKYELYTDLERNCGFLMGENSGQTQIYKAKFVLPYFTGVDFSACGGLWSFNDANSVFPDSDTLLATGFEKVDGDYQVLFLYKSL